MLRGLSVPIPWTQLAYYFFLALFPALLMLVAIVSFIPIAGPLDAIAGTLARVEPTEVLLVGAELNAEIEHASAPRNVPA